MSTIEPSAHSILSSPRAHPERAERVEGSPNVDPSASPQDDRVTSKAIQEFFDSIAGRYDFLNRFLSFRLDDAWRRKAKGLILDRPYHKLLDLGIGTGKFTEEFLPAGTWKHSVGLDFSASMLESAKRQLSSSMEYVNGDFLALPFSENSFDLVISAFTLRSVKNMPLFLKQIYKLLESGGKAAFLCLTRPENFFFKLLYYPYLKIYLPLMGGLISGNRQAYEFLSQSILHFQEPEKTAASMHALGFREIEIRRFTFGAATLIMGRK